MIFVHLFVDESLSYFLKTYDLPVCVWERKTEGERACTYNDLHADL